MGEDGKRYDVEDFNKWKRKQGSAYKIPPRANFLAAANWIRHFFDGKKINWAVTGGLAMLCLGSRREMPDIHVVYDDREYHRVIAKLEKEQRVRLPNSINPLFPTKLLIQTGPKLKDAGCTENIDVELDLVPPGSHGSPPNDVFRNNQVMLRLDADGKAESLKGLNLLYLVKSTLYYCRSKDIVWDPRRDVLFLCQNYGKEIESIRGQLNTREVQENFLGTAFLAKLPQEEQRRCYRVLLGRDPPPAMSITPPAPSTGHRLSAPEVNQRQRVTSHKSSPVLNGNMQQRPSTLSPPLPGRPKEVPTAPKSAPPTQHAAATRPPQQGLPTSAAGARDSHARYRYSSAPNTPGASRNVGPEVNTANAVRPRSMDVRGLHQQPAPLSHKSNGASMQNAAHVSRLQLSSGPLPAGSAAPPMAMHTQKSMPAIQGRPSGSVPIFAHGQKAMPPVSRSFALPPQAHSSGGMLPGLSVSQRAQSQALPQVASQSAQHHHNRPPPTSTNPRSSVQPFPSSSGSLPYAQHATKDPNHISQELAGKARHTGSDTNPSDGLRVVGPEGLYGVPASSTTKVEQHRPLPPSNREHRGAAPSTLVFELDATSSLQAAIPLQHCPSNTHIAELSAEVDVTPRAEINTYQQQSRNDMVVSPLQNSANMGTTRSELSPVSPPTSYHAVLVPVRSLQPEAHGSSVHSRAHSAPFGVLPQSLMVGGPGAQHQHPRNSFSQPPAQVVNRQTHAQAHQHYHTPPSSAPASTQHLPKQAPVPAYKAYNSPINLSLQPAATPPGMHNLPPTMHMRASMSAAQSHLEASGPSSNFSGPGSQAPHHNTMQFHSPVPTAAHSSAPSAIPPHQGQNQYSTKSAGGISHTTHSYQVVEQVEFHSLQYHQSRSKTQYQPYINTQFPHSAEHNDVYEEGYFTPQSAHERNISQDSHSSIASHDSEKLALEYQLDLPDYDRGYSSDEPRSRSAEGVRW